MRPLLSTLSPAQLVAELHALLNASALFQTPSCPCRACEQIRSEAEDEFECVTCGFRGLPKTDPSCRCRSLCSPSLDLDNPRCFHGDLLCPVCGSGSPEGADGEYGWYLISQIRDLLDQMGRGA